MLTGERRAELIAQVFNLFGNDSFGVGATPWQMNATSSSFRHRPHRIRGSSAELACWFVW